MSRHIRLACPSLSAPWPQSGPRSEKPFLPTFSGKSASVVLATLALALAGAQAHAQDSAWTPLIETGANPTLDALAMPAGSVELAIGQLPKVVQQVMQASGVPGVAVAVVHQGRTAYMGGFGLRRLGQPERINPDTVFQIASISKSVTASVIATQVSQGKVQWHDPVHKHLPGFRLSDSYVTQHATIGDFMAHRSGLPFAAGDDLEQLGYSRETILERLRQLPLDTFRLSYHYANFGTTTAAQAVAAAAGQTWENLVEDALFRPLGMASSSARHADYLARPNRAWLHAYEDGRFQPLYDRNPQAQAPAGGVSSSVRDLAEWMKFLLAEGRHGDKAVANAQALLPAMQPQSFPGRPRNPAARTGTYGFGFNIGTEASGRVSMNHSGGFILGAGTNFRLLPSADVGVVVLTNGAPVGAAEAIATHFTDLVQYGKPLRDWFAAYKPLMQNMLEPVGDLAGQAPPALPAPALQLEQYTGSYDNAYFGPSTVRHLDGTLWLELGPKPVRHPLQHWNGNTFAIAPQSEDQPSGSRSSVTFSVINGTVASMHVDYLNDSGLATWTRAD